MTPIFAEIIILLFRLIFFTLILFVLYCYLALIELINLLIMVTEFLDFF